MKNQRYYLLGAGLSALAYLVFKKLNEPALDGRLQRVMEEALDKDTFRVISELRERVKSGKICPLQARGYLRGIIPIGTIQQELIESQPYRGLRIDEDGSVYLR